MALAYSVDLSNSARRHLKAAQLLDDPKAPAARRRRDVAGYLYGVAAECAVKELMRASGMRRLANRRDDPFFAHFPELKTLLNRFQPSGRRAGELRKIAEDAVLMHEWNTDMRYAPSSDVPDRLVDKWRKDAERLVGQIGTI